jgi:uncharacterized protein
VDPGPLRDVLTAVLGFFTGVLSGAFGVGGAVLSTPGIRALGVAPIVAVGTTLPSIFPSAATGAWRYSREGLIDRTAVLLTIPTGLVASVVGALLSEAIPGGGHVLMLFTAALLLFTAVRMARPPAAPAAAEADVEAAPDSEGAGLSRSRLAFAGVGVGAGLLSGLLGIGGGVVMVPGFSQIAGLSIKSAVATSLVCVAAFAVPGTVTHALLGNIDWRVALILTVAVIPGARVGAALALRASDVGLRRAVAVFLGVIAVIYAVGELLSLAS